MEHNSKTQEQIDAAVASAADKLRTAAIPIVVIAFVSGWAASPLIRFASPSAMWSLATCLALLLAAFCISIMFRDIDDKKQVAFRNGMICLVGALVAGCGLLILGVVAAANSNRLDRQCELLEIDSMSLKPRRKDSLDLFEKLGCRTQGVGTLEFEGKLPANSWVRG